MRRQNKRIRVFIILLITSILIFILSKNGWNNFPTSVLQSVSIPLHISTQDLLQKKNHSEITKLQTENIELKTQLVKLQELRKDNKALRDQFALTNPSPRQLLPAYIIGMPTLLTGVTSIDSIKIDKGINDGIKIGNKVIYKDNLLGRVVKTSPKISVVQLVNHKNFSDTAKATQTETTGIIKGTGGKNIILSNVALTDKLQVGDSVATNDPNPLVIGKIISVNKKASSLFQSAEINGLVDVTSIKIVFVIQEP